MVLFPFTAYSQEKEKIVPRGTEGIIDTVDAATGKIKNPKANDFDGPVSTFRIGMGLIYDGTTYSQDRVFKEQMDTGNIVIDPKIKLRDFRVLGSGILKTKRSISWKFAYMWDGDNDKWLLRETGVIIGVPELAGNFFIGRTKEGFSMPKVMNGHSPWTNERQMAIDPIPILADGIKWMGYLPKSRLFWNLAYFNNFLSKKQSFATYQWQFVSRVGWLPLLNDQQKKVIHIGGEFRYGKPKDGKMTLKSRPESNPTPQLINTGEFQTDRAFNVGGEIYYRNKSLMLGSEVVLHNFYSDKSEDHQFYGGDVVISYFFTGAVRPYNTIGSIFGFVPVKKSVFKGGWGEIEGVLRASTFNLNDGSIKGGQMTRITPMINWYMSKIVRMEFIYGYGILDRYNLKGHVQFFESRIQFTVM
jgi:phosphate-selective porin OprO/OprP